jgi:hypothetical protein
MAIRRSFAVSVALLVLCVSSFASVCELNCTLPHSNQLPVHPIRLAAVPDVQAVPAMSHSHCGHAMTGSSKNGSAASYTDRSKCSGQLPCDTATIFSAPSKVSDNAGRVSGIGVVTVELLRPATIGGDHPAKLIQSHAPPKLPQVNPLSVALRI